MRIDYLSSDILLFRGDSEQSLATAFLDGERVLLVDSLGSEPDTAEMRAYLEDTRGLRIELIVLAHGDRAHLAGLGAFGGARIVAHRLFTEAPATPVDQRLDLAWGRHALELFHAPGMRAGTLGVDAPGADLLIVPDRLAGNIAWLGTAAPEQADAALAALQRRGHGRIVAGHVGVQDGAALANARHYLAQLGARVQHLRSACPPHDLDQTLSAIALEDCLAPGVFATPFERSRHRQNLAQVAARGLFPAAAASPAAPPAHGCLARCRQTLASVLTAMLGGMAERGV